MPIYGCSNGLAVTALVATLLLLPSQYYVPNYHKFPEPVTTRIHPESIPTDLLTSALPLDLDVPGVDLLLTVSFIIIAMVIYFCDWIQRKLMERRIVKLNQYLSERVEKLRAWDSRQAQQEGALQMARNATSEYNLLVYLLLRQHKLPPAGQPCASDGDDGDDEPSASPSGVRDCF